MTTKWVLALRHTYLASRHTNNQSNYEILNETTKMEPNNEIDFISFYWTLRCYQIGCEQIWWPWPVEKDCWREAAQDPSNPYKPISNSECTNFMQTHIVSITIASQTLSRRGWTQPQLIKRQLGEGIPAFAQQRLDLAGAFGRIIPALLKKAPADVQGDTREGSLIRNESLSCIQLANLKSGLNAGCKTSLHILLFHKIMQYGVFNLA